VGVVSKRRYDSKRFPLSVEQAKVLTATDGSIKPDIQFAELRLGNTCNIKCITCNPNSSNTFGKEYEEIRKRPEMDFLRDYSWVKPKMSDWTKDENFWSSLAENTPNLKEVYINGGEPMLIKQHVAFLEKLVNDGRASKVRLTYSINMTKLIENIRPLWKEFAEVHFSCSIDAWENKNFYIRYPSPCHSVTENFSTLMM
jgi:MoaA/NifB/PqqE/SkfB family radical SAM enzyme